MLIMQKELSSGSTWKFWKCQELNTFWNNTFVLLSSILKKKLDCLVINGEVDLKKRMALIFMTAAKT